MAGGDVNLGRGVGTRLLADPDYDPFVAVEKIFRTADVVFANLESPLSYQTGETQSPREPMVFTGPPGGADTLAKAGIDIVSVANNHSWDYGLEGFSQTLDNLNIAHVHYAGGSLKRNEQYHPTVLKVGGWSVALFAVTEVWNPGAFERHEGRDYVAWADIEKLRPELARARKENDVVLVSYHGGKEYQENPSVEQIVFSRAVMALGVDAVIGHHPHVPQSVAWFGDRPAFYSLGNLVFGVHRDHEWAGRSYLARLTFFSNGKRRVEACPFVIDGHSPKSSPDLLVGETGAEFRNYLDRAAVYDPRAVVAGSTDECFELVPRPRSVTARGRTGAPDGPRQ